MEKRLFHTSKEQRARLLLLAALFVSSLIIYRSFIFGEELLVFNDVGGDTWQQYTMHYASIVNHLREGSFSLWDFTNGFGVSIFNLNLFDPTLMLLYGLGVIFGPAYMLFFLVWLQIGKILLSGWVFYWFLSQFSFGRQGKLLAAYCYGLSGYLLVWGQHYQFGMVTVYLPLMLLFCEKSLRGKRKRALFPLTVFACGIYSVYFTYMCLIAVGFYLVFRLLSRELAWRERGKKFVGGCCQMLLGLGMSFVVFLPTAAVLLNVSSRLDKKRSLLELLEMCLTPAKGEYYQDLLIRPFSTNLQNLQELGDKTFEGFWNYYESPVLFCSTLAVFSAVQLLLLFWKTEYQARVKGAVYGAAAFMLALLLLPLGGYAFNAFAGATYRYTFVLIPFFLMAMAWMLDHIRRGGGISVIGVLVVCLFMYPAYRAGYEDSLFLEYRINACILAATGTVMAAALLGTRRFTGEKGRSRLLLILTAALAVNVVSEGGITYQDRVTLKKEDTPPELMGEELARYAEEVSGMASERQARAFLAKPQDYFRELYSEDIQRALDYLEETDPSFYRVEKDFSSATVSMDAQAQGYRGISTYNSVMNGNVKDFVSTCCPSLYYSDRNRYVFWDNAENNWLAAFTGVRYLLSRSGELDPEKYTLLQQFGSVYLYENARGSQMVRFYDKTVSEEVFREVDKKTRKKLLSALLVLEEGQEQAPQRLKASKAQKSSEAVLDAPQKDSRITGRVQAASDGYLLFMIPYEEGWTLTVDGEETPLMKGDLGFLACGIQEGSHSLELVYHAPLLREGAFLSLAFWLIWVFWILRIENLTWAGGTPVKG
ncbi:MAG: YfhO family protein [Eubacteriales bacterium]|nr:YfhO family protein [Eubacteriales bacterium]